MKNKYEEIPAWCAEAMQNLKAGGWKPETDFSHLKEEYNKAFENLARTSDSRKKAQLGIVDMVITTGCKLLSASASLFEIPVAAPAYASRAVEKRRAGQQVHNSCYKESHDGSKICFTLLTENATPKIKVNLVKADNSDIRPFTIDVRDENGKQIISPVTVEKYGQPPLFPAPSTGLFNFILDWEGNKDNMIIEVEQEENNGSNNR